MQKGLYQHSGFPQWPAFLSTVVLYMWSITSVQPSSWKHFPIMLNFSLSTMKKKSSKVPTSSEEMTRNQPLQKRWRPFPHKAPETGGFPIWELRYEEKHMQRKRLWVRHSQTGVRGQPFTRAWTLFHCGCKDRPGRTKNKTSRAWCGV